MMKPSRLQKQTTDMLLKIDDLRAIAPLIDVVHTAYIPNDVECEAVKAVLIPLLQRLRASDSSLISLPQHVHFQTVLRHWDHHQRGTAYGTDYILAVHRLAASRGGRRYSVCGTRSSSRSHPHAADKGRHLVRKGFNTAQDLLNGRQLRKLDKPRIMRAAQDCLPYLQQKAEQQRVSNTLLRASAPEPIRPTRYCGQLPSRTWSLKHTSAPLPAREITRNERRDPGPNHLPSGEFEYHPSGQRRRSRLRGGRASYQTGRGAGAIEPLVAVLARERDAYRKRRRMVSVISALSLPGLLSFFVSS